MLALRPYQIELIDKVRSRLRNGTRSVLITSPTGSGKTCMVAHMLGNSTQKGYRAWFVVHRRELVKQSVLTLSESAGLPLGIVAAGFPGNRLEPIQVCSMQTLARRHHLLQPPDLIVLDEAHHTPAKTWAELIAKFPRSVIIGLTATPERLDGTGLSGWFEELVTGPSVSTLIEQGWLSPYRLFAPGGPDLSAVHTVAGDYNKKELAVTMAGSAVVGDALSHYQKYAMGRRAVVFMWSIESSVKIVERFNAAGIPAAHLDGDTDDVTRDAVIDGFRNGRIKILSNVEIVSEGFDVPNIEAVFLLRPTRSLGLYLQQCGRGLRPSPGKTELLIFDHAGLCRTFGLPDDDRQWSLDGRVKRKSDSDAAPVKQCPRCYAMMSAGRITCKWCGFTFEVHGRDVPQIEGELAEMDLEARRRERKREQASAQSYDELVRIGYARGYKSPQKWATHVLNARAAKQAGREAERFALQIPAGWS